MFNTTQSNLDGYELGDACEPDADGDGVADDTDNCLTTGNVDERDRDLDGQGDACDLDRDGDRVNDSTDACLDTPTGVIVLTTGCSLSETCPPADDELEEPRRLRELCHRRGQRAPDLGRGQHDPARRDRELRPRGRGSAEVVRSTMAR